MTRPEWCLLEINHEVSGKSSHSHLILQGQYLEEFLSTRRGEGALARAVLLGVERASRLTNEQILGHLRETASLTKADSYLRDLKSFEKLIQGPVESLHAWREVFGKFQIKRTPTIDNPALFTLFLPPKSPTSRVFAFIRERS